MVLTSRNKDAFTGLSSMSALIDALTLQTHVSFIKLTLYIVDREIFVQMRNFEAR